MAMTTLVAGIVLGVVALVFRLFLPVSVAVRYVVDFVIGAGAGAVLAIGILAMTMGTGTLQTGSMVLARLGIITVSAVHGGTALSWHLARRFRYRVFASRLRAFVFTISTKRLFPVQNYVYVQFRTFVYSDQRKTRFSVQNYVYVEIPRIS
jgi:hypothetical protein